MFRIIHFPFLIGYRAVGWMEKGLSQDNFANCFSVSYKFVQRLRYQYQSEESVSIMHVASQQSDATLAKILLLVHLTRWIRTISMPLLVADHFVALGRRISSTSVWRRLHNPVFYARDQLCVFPSSTSEKSPLIMGKRIPFLDQIIIYF